MAITARVIVTPDVGQFRSTTFDDLLRKGIHQPGLDPQWRHTLIGVQVAPDGSHAELTIHSEPHIATSLTNELRIVSWEPDARVRAHDEDGNELAAVALPAPLRVGERVTVGPDTYRVTREPTWPHRDPNTGRCKDTIDWQHVVLTPDPQPAHTPTLTAE